MNTFAYIIFSLLVLVGVAYIIKSVFFGFFKYNTSDSVCPIILLKDKNEVNVRSIIEQIRHSNLKFKSIVAVDTGINEQDKNAIVLLLRDYNIPLIEKEEVGEYLIK